MEDWRLGKRTKEWAERESEIHQAYILVLFIYSCIHGVERILLFIWARQLILTFPHYNPYKFAACTYGAIVADSCNVPVMHLQKKKCCLVSIITGSSHVVLSFYKKSVCDVPGYWCVTTHTVWFNISTLQICILQRSVNMVLVMLQHIWMDYRRSLQGTYTIQVLTKHSDEKWWKSGSEWLGLVVMEWDNVKPSGRWWLWSRMICREQKQAATCFIC